MKNERMHTFLCSAGICFCLGLGSTAGMVTGLELPVSLRALVLLHLFLAAAIAGLTCLRYGGLICLVWGGIVLLKPDLWIEFKTIGVAVCMRLELAYQIPIPELFQGDHAQQVSTALCFVGGAIMVAAAWAVQRQKTALPAAVLSLLPLGCCITVIDTVPGSVWLFLWGLGLILMLMTQQVRKECAARGNRLTAVLVIPTALVLLLLFWIVPRNAPDRWSLADLPEAILSRFSGNGPETSGYHPPPKVDLSSLEKRQQKQTAVMDVTADFTGPLYLRGRDYDAYTGTGWHSTPNRTEAIYGFLPEFYEKDGAVTVQVRQPQSFYYLPAATVGVQFLTDGQATNPAKETEYRFGHCSLRNDWLDVWKDSSTSYVDPRYVNLPQETLLGARDYLNTREEFEAYQSGETSIPDMAEQIRQWLRNHVPYDLSTANMPESETDLALWFLKDAKTGYCVHYATAAVVLLRACGIPARYVEGYAVNVRKGQTVTVRELHAHAWAEYYVNGAGWLVLEVTPSGGNTPEVPETTQPTQTQPSTTQPTAPATIPTEPEKPPVTPEKTLPQWIKPLLMKLAWAAAALALVWGQYRFRRLLFQRAVRTGGHNRRALNIYRRLCRLSKWTKKPVPPELTQLAQKARFSPHILNNEELFQLRGYLKRAETSVSVLPLYQRLIAKWIFARY